jgi:tripartite-type tricarboxylate transporter receptor subunit TctC
MKKLVTIFVLALSMSGVASGAEYPARTLTIVVGASPGGAADAQARLIAKSLSQRLGKPVIVDNRSGAGGRLAAQLVARAAPDGHTLFLCSTSMMVIEPLLRTNVAYDPERDFAPVAMVGEFPLILVASAALPVSTVEGLINLARERPGEFSYASWGPGTLSLLYGEVLKRANGIELVHVPYKGAGPALLDILGGQVSVMFASTVSAASHVRTGKLKPLAVTGTRRVPGFPAVPTLRESGISGFEVQGWFGMVVPAKTPEFAQARLKRELASIVSSKDFVRSFEAQGGFSVDPDPTEVSRRLRADTASISKLVKALNFKVEE